MAPLRFGVAPGLLPLIYPLRVQAILTHITGGEDVRGAGAQSIVDTNPLPHGKASRYCKLDVRLHANADNHCVTKHTPAVDQQH